MKIPFLLMAGCLFACTGNTSSHPGDTAPGGMAFIPGGEFVMGTDSTDLPVLMNQFDVPRIELLLPEVPRRRVTVEDFYLDTADVTNADYHVFVSERPEWAPSNVDSTLHNGRYLEHWRMDTPREDDLQKPVTFVSWYSAVTYCAWKGTRLPTEAEWEYAASAGDSENVFPWGSEVPNPRLVNWGGNEFDGPLPVASYPPNAFGLYDMAGNVWKFLMDEWHDSHLHATSHPGQFNPDTAPEVNSRRVIRGGSWSAAAVNLRNSYRDSHPPREAREMIGFRCARSIS